MNTVQILKDARALIADEKNWTQGEYARDANGTPQTRPNQGSVCFCSIGAVAKVMGIAACEAESYGIVKKLVKAGGFTRVSALVEFNDTHTHTEVLALFDRAIASAESEDA